MVPTIPSMDPLISTAFRIYSSPGTTALLLGSGVSRSAEIPTGWEVVVDLIRRLAAGYGENCDPDPAAWYSAKFGKDPGYSELLLAVAKTQAERQRLLRGYFEPTPDERAAGKKLPTKAHNAVADQISTGYFRVVLTTNFDRLLEEALRERGTVPTVISTADAVDGALPLTHSGPTVIKLHGDYLDTRILNTPSELSKYKPKLSKLLARVLDEFGLIVCGWSADWDVALVDAFMRCPTRRFDTTWAARGALSGQAARVVAQRQGTVVPISDADSFFDQLKAKIDGIAAANAPHPLSRKIAVASAKRMLADERLRIDLRDLAFSEAQRTLEGCKQVEKDLDGLVNRDGLLRRRAQYEQAVDLAAGIHVQLGRWAKAEQLDVIAENLRLVGSRPDGYNGREVWLQLRLYPALLLAYATGVAAVHGGNWGSLAALWSTRLARLDAEEPLVTALHPEYVLRTDIYQQLTVERLLMPVSEMVFKAIKEPLMDLIGLERDYEAAFDRFELLWSLETLHRGGGLRLGRFVYRSRFQQENALLKALMAEVKAWGPKWSPLASGLCGGSADRVLELSAKLAERLGSSSWM
jgi:hypothetical protein